MMTKKSKGTILLIYVCILSILASCLTFNGTSAVAHANCDIDFKSDNEQDDEILKYHHEPALIENFEDDTVSVILKSGYSGEIGSKVQVQSLWSICQVC